MLKKIPFLLFPCLLLSMPGAVFGDLSGDLLIEWRSGQEVLPLVRLTLQDLAGMKQSRAKEPAPQTSAVSSWQGPALSLIVEEGMKKLPAARRAQVDLVVLHGRGGVRALLPRAFVVKYPILVAARKEGSPLDAATGPLATIVPWSSNKKIQLEGVPLESFFVSGLERIEFANYRELYGSVFLKRRTDPAAMRGERLFVQNCLACHAAGQGPAVSEIARVDRNKGGSDSPHPEVRGVPSLTSRDRRALRSYLDAFLGEQGSDRVGQSQASSFR